MNLRVLIRIALAMLLLSLAGATAFLFTAPGKRLVNELQNRSPQELVRYTKRRLSGHTKLETVFLPPLHWAQRYFEREPMLVSLPTLGKGQQATAPSDTPPGMLRVWHVATSQEIRRAMKDATPGTRIVVTPGLYLFDANIYLGLDGEKNAPIVLQASQPGTVWFEFTQLDGIMVNKPHWRFENLNIRGTCAHHQYCEHAFHVVGRGYNAVIRNNLIVDFNAHIKVNGFRDDWPDHGTLTHNTLMNRSARNTDKPVTPFDLVGANYWQVADNVVANFIKLGGNQVSYGMFMKGASEGGRFERNLVICSMDNISQPGIRVGLSFGAGESGPDYCRDKSCSAYENIRGIAANNIIAHCNDTGIDVNRSLKVALIHNTLINTSGIALRGQSEAIAQGNLYEGVMTTRNASTLVARWNQRINANGWFTNPDVLDLTWLEKPFSIPTAPQIETDFYGHRRSAGSMPGAFK